MVTVLPPCDILSVEMTASLLLDHLSITVQSPHNHRSIMSWSSHSLPKVTERLSKITQLPLGHCKVTSWSQQYTVPTSCDRKEGVTAQWPPVMWQQLKKLLAMSAETEQIHLNAIYIHEATTALSAHLLWPWLYWQMDRWMEGWTVRCQMIGYVMSFADWQIKLAPWWPQM